MSSIHCPYCQHEMKLTGVKPGLFHPACPECRAQFRLTISPDPTVAPQVIALGVLPGSATIAEDPTDRSAVTQATVSASAAATQAAPVATNAPTLAAPPPRYTAPQATRTLTTPAWEARAAGHMKLGGYEILKILGEGGMGKVYLARQLSLARNVALKVLSPRLASDLQFIARFTREAFAAAQLTHHNVVQIHDIGVERTRDSGDTNFFSMELVEGQSLGAIINKSGKLDPETAVGYALQAARGLKFAHDHGLIHRDVKPDNLLLNTQGVVKVADLGLVKRAGVADPSAALTLSRAQAAAAAAGTTLPSAVMGTPDYMPPEQARDASSVDARADIYSLGCSLYEMLTGHAPFAGRSIEAVLAAHASEVPVAPDRVVKNIPPVISQIVMKMIAKRPEDRYATMDEVVAAMEHAIGVESEKPFAPPEDYLKVLEMSGERYHNCAWRAARTAIIRGFFAVSLLATIVLAIPAVGHPFFAAAVLGFAMTTTIAYQLIYGLARRTFFMSKLRQLAFNSSFADWATYFVVATLGVGLLIAFGVHWIFLGSSVAAILVALLFYTIVDRELAKEREVSLEQTEKMLKALRLHGTDENTIRHFVCRYCGRQWEEFYEALFGYEAKMKARQAWNRGELSRARPRYATWREPIIAWIDQQSEARHEENQRQLLARIEAEALQARGMDPYEATIQARQSINRLMDNAAGVRALASKRSSDGSRTEGALARSALNSERVPSDWMEGNTHYRARRRAHGSYLQRRYGSPLDIVVGRGVRLIGAMLILIGFGLWWSNNGALQAKTSAQTVISALKNTPDKPVVYKPLQRRTIERSFSFSDTGDEPLRIDHVPEWLCDSLGCWNGGIAGMLLLLSVFFGGRLMGIAALLSAGTAIFGRMLPISFFTDFQWAIPSLSLGIWLVGVLFLRDATED